MRRLAPLAFAFVLGIAPLAPVLAQGSDEPAARFEITQELLDDAVAKARPAVERALGRAIPDGFRGARVADTSDLRRALVNENEPAMLAQVGDEDSAHRQASAFADGLAPALLAKYAFGEDVILVSQEGFERNSDLLAMPELLSEDAVRAVVVHELVHASDVPHFAFWETMKRLDDSDRISALNAVLEGHAQHVARGVCAELGLSKGFDVYCRAIDAEPTGEASMGEAVRLLRRYARLVMARTYLEGESFVAAVEKAAGEDGVARAFQDPPSDMAEIGNPEWFLHPELRPKVRYDLDAALAVFEADYDPAKFTGMRRSIGPDDLRLSFESLDQDVVDRITASLRGARMSMRAEGQDASHYALICEWSSAEAAELAFQASTEISKMRDEQMKKGLVQVESARYEDVQLGEDGPKGVLGHKKLKTLSGRFDVNVMFLHSGSLTFELLRSGQTGTDEEFRAAAARIAAAAEAPAPAGDAPKEGGDAPRPTGDGSTGTSGSGGG